MKKNFCNAFSLMEMLVVLLIISIIAAATAPMVTKKMARSVGSGDSPWVFTGLSNNIAYNMGGNNDVTAIIGATSLPSGWNKKTRLFIDSNVNASHIAFGNGNATPLLLTADPKNGRIGFSNDKIPYQSIAFGINQTLGSYPGISIGNGINNKLSCFSIAIGKEATTSSVDSIALGNNAEARSNNSIALGKKALTSAVGALAIGDTPTAVGYDTIAIGTKANVGANYGIALGSNASGTGSCSIAVGKASLATKHSSIAIGHDASATHQESVAIGDDASATHLQSVAIGVGAQTTAEHQIVLGTNRDTVYIPGNLVVAGYSVLGINGSSRVFLNLSDSNGGNGICQVGSGQTENNVLGVEDKKTNSGFGTSYSNALSWFSDRRLKNVGEKYTAGLDELKKLDFYHYTFKADKDNTPFVGVIAQDLQKVFPDAVTKDESGYLRIRIEDMFYAVINAVKELDTKISEIVTNITDIKATIQSQQETIESLKKENAELKDEIKDIEKRIKKLER